MPAADEMPRYRLRVATAGVVAYFGVITAFNLPTTPGITLGIGAWWCILAVFEDAEIFKRPFFKRVKTLFAGDGWRPPLSVLTLGICLTAPTAPFHSNRFAKPILYLGLPAITLGIMALLDVSRIWLSQTSWSVRQARKLRLEKIREANRPAIVRAVLSELDCIENEISPHIARIMEIRSSELKGAYITKEMEAGALNDETQILVRHKEAAFRATREAIIKDNGKDLSTAISEKKGIDTYLLRLLLEYCRNDALNMQYPYDGYYNIVLTKTRIYFFSILSALLTSRNSQTLETETSTIAQFKTAVSARVASFRS